MHFLLWMFFLVGAVQGRLVNITLDDTSSQITYTATPIFRCPTACDPGFQSQLYNGTSSTSLALVIIPFTGTAAYVYLGVNGTVMFQLDGNYVGEHAGTDGNEIAAALSLDGLSDTLHVLTIVGIDPAHWQNVASFQLDYFVYTTQQTTNHTRTAAIAGGVVGGVAFFVLLYLGMTLLRRQQQQSRRAARGSWFRGHWKDKPSIQMEGMEAT
ncbi:hypothetical protein C8F01DRAFT_1164674 [Mycena amicta]|nr:hypothetical protein C8F01DRAFT_1164674 [Mycena amicta]